MLPIFTHMLCFRKKLLHASGTVALLASQGTLRRYPTLSQGRSSRATRLPRSMPCSGALQRAAEAVQHG
jgi:hypothetical protein